MILTRKNASEKLPEVREKLGLTQEKLAEKTKIQRQTIGRIEAGGIPRAVTVFKINEYLKLFPEE